VTASANGDSCDADVDDDRDFCMFAVGQGHQCLHVREDAGNGAEKRAAEHDQQATARICDRRSASSTADCSGYSGTTR